VLANRVGRCERGGGGQRRGPRPSMHRSAGYEVPPPGDEPGGGLILKQGGTDSGRPGHLEGGSVLEARPSAASVRRARGPLPGLDVFRAKSYALPREWRAGNVVERWRRRSPWGWEVGNSAPRPRFGEAGRLPRSKKPTRWDTGGGGGLRGTLPASPALLDGTERTRIRARPQSPCGESPALIPRWGT